MWHIPARISYIVAGLRLVYFFLRLALLIPDAPYFSFLVSHAFFAASLLLPSLFTSCLPSVDGMTVTTIDRSAVELGFGHRLTNGYLGNVVLWLKAGFSHTA